MKPEEQPPAQTCNRDKPIPTSMKKRIMNGKRFSDEQIKSLESIFKLETKLEPRKKLQLARDLGLQPRQVAIWFQNRRARWKSKHIEEQYTELKAKFDSLSMRFESLKEEKQSLLKQLERLHNLQSSPNGGQSSGKDIEGNGTTDNQANANLDQTKRKEEASTLHNTSFHLEIKRADLNEAGLIKNVERKEEPESSKFGEYLESSLPSPEEWCNLDLGGFSCQSCDTSKWWEF